MFHLITGKIQHFGEFQYISNDFLGIQADYQWIQNSWTYHLFPLMDDNQKTVFYFARDTVEPKSLFLKLIKISWIGAKTAFKTSKLNYQDLEKAVETMNITYFQKTPGVGPKTAKRLVVELKSVIKADDLLKIHGDSKVARDIVKYCKGLGYDSERVKQLLWEYTETVDQSTMSQVITRVIGKL